MTRREIPSRPSFQRTVQPEPSPLTTGTGKGFALVFALLCAGLLLPGTARALVRGTGCCTYDCAGQTTSGCGEIMFNTMAECQAAIAAGPATCPRFANMGCTGLSLYNAVCTDLGGGGGGGGGDEGGNTTGGGNTGPTVTLPESFLFPNGTLLTQSQLEQIAGGFYGLGDISLLGSQFGDAFFNSHYTDSNQNWLREYAERLEALREDPRFRAESRERAAQQPSPFETVPSPSTTRAFENAHMDELGSNFLTQLQMGQTGTGSSNDNRYMTLEEMERIRFQERHGPNTSGIPLMIPEEARVSASNDKPLLDKLKDMAKDKALEWLDLKDVADRVGKAEGILTPWVTDLAEGSMSAANKLAVGNYSGAESQLDSLRDRSLEGSDQAKGMVKDELKSAADNAVGSLVEVGMLDEATKASYDLARTAGEKGVEMYGTLHDGILEVAKRGGDAKAVKDVIVERLGEAKDAVVEQTQQAAIENLVKTPFPTRPANDPKITPDSDGDRSPSRGR